MAKKEIYASINLLIKNIEAREILLRKAKRLADDPLILTALHEKKTPAGFKKKINKPEHHDRLPGGELVKEERG